MVLLEIGYGLLIGVCAGSIGTLYAVLRIGVLQERVYRLIDVYIEDWAAKMEANPKIAQRFITPLINAGLAAMQSNSPREASIKLPLVGKVPLSLLQPFLPSLRKALGSQAAEAASKLPGMTG